MKRNDKVSSWRRLTEKQLSDKITQSKKDLVIHQQQKLLGKAKDTTKSTILKKDIARMKTILDEKVSAAITEENEQN